MRTGLVSKRLTSELAVTATQVETVSGVEEMGKVVEEMTTAAMGGNGEENGTVTPMDTQ